MKKYRVHGEIRIEYRWIVDEEIEVEDDEDWDDALDAVVEDLDTLESSDSDATTYGCTVEEVDDLAPVRADELRKLQEWNAWARGQVAQ